MVVIPRLCIVDASVLIDLEHGGLIGEIFQLNYNWAAPDVLIESEVSKSLRALLRNCGLREINLEEAEVREVLRLRENFKQLSLNDLICLFLSKERRAILVTGDGALRSIAKNRYDVKVRGTLWVLDELFKYQIITGKKAVNCLNLMIKAGGRFPKEECTKRNKQWLESIES